MPIHKLILSNDDGDDCLPVYVSKHSSNSVSAYLNLVHFTKITGTRMHQDNEGWGVQ